MLFFSRSHKILQLAAPVKKVRRYLITVSTCTALVGLWWFGVYTPLCSVGLSYAQQNQTLEQQSKNAQHDVQQCASLETTVKDLHSALDIYNAQVNHDPRETQMSDVMSLIQSTGLSLSGYSVERESDKKSYHKSTMRFSLVGSHQQLLNFFEQVHAKKLLVACKTISLHASSEPATYAITCELASFFWPTKNPST